MNVKRLDIQQNWFRSWIWPISHFVKKWQKCKPFWRIWLYPLYTKKYLNFKKYYMGYTLILYFYYICLQFINSKNIILMVLNRASPLVLATNIMSGIYMQKYSLPGNACFFTSHCILPILWRNTHKNKKLTLFWSFAFCLLKFWIAVFYGFLLS